MDLKIKNSWDQVSVKDFMFIKEITDDANINDLEKDIKILSILAGVNDNYFDKFLITDVKKLMSSLEFLQSDPKAEIKDYYKVGKINYKLVKEVKDLTTAQFIDLSHYTKDKELILDNLHLILSTLLVPVKKRKFLSIKPEKTENYLETPIEITSENIFDNMKITEAMGISLFFCLLSTLFYQTTKYYSGTNDERTVEISFEDVGEGDVEQSNDQKSGKEIESSDWFYSKWSWIATVDRLSDGKRRKWDYFFDMKITEFLNAVSFYKDKAEFQSEQNAREFSKQRAA